MSDDMDVDAGRVLLGEATLDDVGAEIFDLVVATASGAATRSRPSATGVPARLQAVPLPRTFLPGLSPEGAEAAFHIPGGPQNHTGRRTLY